jgi:hypothetical protein
MCYWTAAAVECVCVVWVAAAAAFQNGKAFKALLATGGSLGRI